MEANAPRAARPIAALLFAALAIALPACGDEEPAQPTDSAVPPAASPDTPTSSPPAEPPDGPATIPSLPDNDDPRAVICTGSPEAIFDATAIVGKSESEAAAAAEEEGCSVRVVERDGRALAVTEDFRPDRVNVVVEDGEVTEIVSLG